MRLLAVRRNSYPDVKRADAFTCSATEFLKLLCKEDGSLRKSLFNNNVRDYLGGKGAVNSEIESTLIQNPDMFLLCNNGITIVCSDFLQVQGKVVRIENPQIVNGCQTCNSIYNCRDSAGISKVQLLVRLISTEEAKVSGIILRGTNKQNQVLNEAFEATRPFHQDVLEPFFLNYDGSVRLYYERRAKQYSSDLNVLKTHIVNLRILTQVFVGLFLDAPHESHRHEAKLLEKYGNDEMSRKIFREDHSPYLYYVCARVWYAFERAFRENRIDRRYAVYKAHLYLLFRQVLLEYPPALNRGKQVAEYCEKLLRLLEDEVLSKSLVLIINAFNTAEAAWRARGGSPHGIKDSREFTAVLLETKFFGQTHDKVHSVPRVDDDELMGEVFNIIERHGLWFGFIRRGDFFDNIYFDNRSYKGDVTLLRRGVHVCFVVGSNEKGFFAKSVRIIPALNGIDAGIVGAH